MEYCNLGTTDLLISRIGFGCAPMGGYDYGPVDDKDSIKAVRRGIDLGINFFDTADVYGFGRAESVLGRALGRARNNVVIATKFGLIWDESGRIVKDCSPHRVVRALEDSLRRLKADAVTIYQMHWVDPCTPLQDTMEALLQCQKAGKIRYIGCSNMNEQLIEDVQEMGRVETFQSSYNLLNRRVETHILPCCQKFNMSFVAHSPLSRGFLSGKYRPGHSFLGTDTRDKSTYFSMEKKDDKEKVLSNIDKMRITYNKTSSQIALRWILDNPLVSGLIVGAKDVCQVVENVGSIHWNLTSEDYTNLALHSETFVHEVLY